MQNKPQNQEMEIMAQQQQKRKDFWKRKDFYTTIQTYERYSL